MADHSSESRSQLPPGWECRFDGRSGRQYFINHFNRSTTWEDPRVRYWQIAHYMQSQSSTTPSSVNTEHQIESLPLQTSGTSSIGHLVYSGSHRVPQVYPSPSPYRNPQPAFLPPSLQDLKTPLSMRSTTTGLTTRMGDMTIGSPTPLRSMEKSLIEHSDIELQVAKINAMFPTVSDTHIRFLLKKYHNRPALVVSALQVEKNPLCQPGPCTPIGVRSNYSIQKWRIPTHAIQAALTLSPPRSIIRKRTTPSSPKMKLRYLKSLFPSVDESILLDSLEQRENNTQDAIDRLVEFGYEKRNPLQKVSKAAIKKIEEEKKKTPTPPPPPVTPTPPPRLKSLEEKTKMKKRLLERFQTVPEKVIVLAMESVDYDEERAAHLLDIMVVEEAIQPLRKSASQGSDKTDGKKETPPVTQAIKLHVTPIQDKIIDIDGEKIKSKHKSRKEIPKVSKGTSTMEDSQYRSPYLTEPKGPNPEYAKGANNDCLLPDYAPWSGADPTLLLKNSQSRTTAVGKNPGLVAGSGLAKGPDPELRKGPMNRLNKGSVYSQRNVDSIEIRGK